MKIAYKPRKHLKAVKAPPLKSKGLKTQKKPKSISKLIKEADALFSRQVRMRGAWQDPRGVWWNRCFTTGYEAPVSKLHAGHYLSRYYKAARWHRDNCRPQSVMANIWMKGDSVKFRQNLVKEIGEERVLAVEALRDAPIKLSREYLENLIRSLKEQEKTMV